MAASTPPVVKVIYHEILPYQRTVYRNGKPALGGSTGKILDAIAEIMNATFEVRRVSHSNYGTELPNGTWTGMVGALQKGEADACFSLSIGSYARSKVVRLGPVVSYQDNAILSGSESARFDAFEYLQAFDRKTWLILFIALLVLAFLISLSDWLKSREGGNRGSSLGGQIHENAWTLFGFLLCEGFPRPFARTSQRLLVGVWLAAVVILSNTFASLLKSRHAVGNSVPIADSIVDVAPRSYLRPIIAAGTYYEQLDKDSSSPHVKKVWEMARKKKGMVPLHAFFSDGNLRQVAERQAVMAMERGSMLFNMAAFCEREGVRNFYVAQQLIEQTPFVYMFSKHLDRQIYEEIFKKIKLLFEAGLVQKWMSDSLGNWQQCIQGGGGSCMRNIDLEDSASWFFLWTMVLACASLVFFLEIGSARLAQKRKVARHNLGPNFKRTVGQQRLEEATVLDV